MLGKIHRIDVLGRAIRPIVMMKAMARTRFRTTIRLPTAPAAIVMKSGAYGLRNPGASVLTGSRAICLLAMSVITRRRDRFEPSTSPGGTNYGWPCYEGRYRVNRGDSAETLVFPAYVFAHEDACASVTVAMSSLVRLIRRCMDTMCLLTSARALLRGGCGFGETPWAVVTTVYPGVNPTTFGENLAGDLFVGHGIRYDLSRTIRRLEPGEQHAFSWDSSYLNHMFGSKFVDLDVVPCCR